MKCTKLSGILASVAFGLLSLCYRWFVIKNRSTNSKQNDFVN